MQIDFEIVIDILQQMKSGDTDYQDDYTENEVNMALHILNKYKAIKPFDTLEHDKNQAHLPFTILPYGYQILHYVDSNNKEMLEDIENELMFP